MPFVVGEKINAVAHPDGTAEVARELRQDFGEGAVAMPVKPQITARAATVALPPRNLLLAPRNHQTAVRAIGDPPADANGNRGTAVHRDHAQLLLLGEGLARVRRIHDVAAIRREAAAQGNGPMKRHALGTSALCWHDVDFRRAFLHSGKRHKAAICGQLRPRRIHLMGRQAPGDAAACIDLPQIGFADKNDAAASDGWLAVVAGAKITHAELLGRKSATAYRSDTGPPQRSRPRCL